MIQKMEKILKALDVGMIALSAAIMGIMTLLIFAQVICRYVLKMPLAWSEEGARFLFIWVTFIAGYVGARRAQHISVELVQDLFSKKVKKGMQFFSNLIASGFFGLVVFHCIKNWDKLEMQTSPALGITMSMVYLGIVIGCVGMALCYLLNAMKLVAKDEGGENA